MRLLPAFLLLVLALPAAAQTHEGTLGPQSAQREDGIPYDAQTITLKQHQRFTARLESTAFDTYLLVKGPAGNEYVNDDFGSTEVSQVEFIAPQEGTYTVWASTYDASGAGAYTLTLAAGAQATVTTTEGRLDGNDALLPKGERADTYERTFDTTGPFDIELVSYGFDGYLAVQAPSGTWYRNDDAGDTTRSLLSDLQPEPGTWRIVVTSAMPEEMGAYDLRVLTYPR